MRDNTYTQLLECAIEVRSFLEKMWPQWHQARGETPETQSEGTCGRSSFFLKRVYFEELRIEAVFATGGKGCGLSQSGFFSNGKWHNHSWLEVAGNYIVDLTADQFNEPPITIVPIADPRYLKGEHDCAYPEEIENRHRMVDRIWPEWVKYKNT